MHNDSSEISQEIDIWLVYSCLHTKTDSGFEKSTLVRGLKEVIRWGKGANSWAKWDSAEARKSHQTCTAQKSENKKTKSESEN